MAKEEEYVAERDEPLQVVQVRGYCPLPDCGGELLGTGYGMSTDRSRWVNRCSKCGVERWLIHSYPYIGYRSLQATSKDGTDAA